MGSSKITTPVFILLLLGCFLPSNLGFPTDPAAALAADPAAAAVPVAVAAPPPVAVAPVVEAAPAVVAADPVIATKAIPAVQQPVSGGGIITEHKNPDGSTITVTRYNGPLPASAFQNPLLGGGIYSSGLHDSSSHYANNIYQNQLLQLQALRNLQLFNYNGFYSSPITPTYPYYHRTPYVYPSSGYHPFVSPFFGYGGYPSPYGYPGYKTV